MTINDFAAQLKAMNEVNDDLLKAVAPLCREENRVQVREAAKYNTWDPW
ncbi:MAG: hypothetical protein ETSY1_12885 [Candidatus Entotheonella factor]|uniref:Uncharacterized protein n=1 Tax=Entotheonella factor TaxID=1429438 RepID=W4LRH4_ENTF1|nr:MAG: hypothetical protein ETSY1_12885 [Candidatus Entotheonella factor]